MKNIILLTLFLFCCFIANSQDYLKEANSCFEKGDYECAKRNYTLFQTLDGRNMSVQIQKSDECLRNLIMADEYFKDKEYSKARDRYKIVLDKNPKDSYTKKQYEACELQMKPINDNYIETKSNLNIEMVFVQGGTFTMGCTPEQGNNYGVNEKPTHQVALSNFYIGKYEITQAQWKAIMGSNPSNFKGDNLPVEKVSWNNVQEFIRRLNTQTGKQYRLPTEAEWEFAARGGNRSNSYKYSGSNTIDNVAWYNKNSGNKTHAVGTKQANELGIYDMIGNVWEWCNDWFDNYSSSAQINPKGPSSGSYRVNRGGSWINIAQPVHISYRLYSTPDDRYYFLGFRLACSSE